MCQGQLFGVQGDAGNQRTFFASGLEAIIRFQPREPERFAAVKLVADNGKTRVLNVNPDLMRAIGERFAFQKRVAAAGKSFQHFKSGFGFLAVLDQDEFGPQAAGDPTPKTGCVKGVPAIVRGMLDVDALVVGRQRVPALALRLLMDPGGVGLLRWPLPAHIESVTIEPGRAIIRTAS
jgi:hypothetical protein